MQLVLSRILAFCAVLLTAASVVKAANPAPPDAVTLTPTIVVAGSPELIRVSAPASAVLEGDWQERSSHSFAAAMEKVGSR